jgi:Predicted nucleoside-diphosphate sugar epimerases
MNKYIRLMALLVCDAILVAASVYLSYLLRFDFEIRPQFKESLIYVIPVYIVLMLVGFYSFKIYKRIWQYASVGDIIAIVKGTLVGSVLFFTLHYFLRDFIYPSLVVPRSIYLLTTIISLLMISSSRVMWRLLRDNYIKIQPHHRRALIIGAGEAGVMVVRELKHSERAELYPIAFIDDDQQKQNYEVVGVPVVGTRKDIQVAVRKYKIEDIIVAIPTAPRGEIIDILNISKSTGCQIKIIPKVNDLIHGKISISMIRDVSVEDLLGREPIQLDINSISGYVKNNVVLVTGAGGSIGAELCRQIIQFSPKQLLLLGRGENSIYEIELELRKKYPSANIEPIIADVQDKRRLIEVFALYGPQVIFHAAAHKHVPLMERNPLEAIKNNILGTFNVAECAHEFAAERFVMVSTDKAVNPTNVMGASKRAAEMIVQSLDRISQTSFSSVRFGNVLGSRGSVIPLFKRQIEEGGPVTVTHPEMIRYFMTIPEAVQLVIQTAAISAGGEVFILDMGKPVRIIDLAKDLIRLSGLDPEKDIEIVFSGIRPGEKLYEELLTAEEGALGTKYDRIYVGKPEFLQYKDIKKMISQFEQLLQRQERPQPEEVRMLLQLWVPTYKIHHIPTRSEVLAADEAYRASLEIVAAIDNR